ncbi:hypothetical protein [Tumebacillus flagellatus]|uniref:hypothetical protein n=1 Tax=Tumebacillus flagellatus TaxID=1157490 RepID=UPI00126963FB|nr:hypothetical protein [Tumebacillus flagellatus]
MLFLLKPEVAGGFGENTQIRKPDDEPLVSKHVVHLHYEFEGWLGDELLTSHPCYIVTDRVSELLKRSGCTGLHFETVEVSTSEMFLELEPNVTLPSFKRMIPLGSIVLEGDTFEDWSGHDFSMNERCRLVVSEKALEVLQPYIKNYCVIIPLTPKLKN